MDSILLTNSLGYVGRGTVHGIYTAGSYLVNGAHAEISSRIEALDIVNKVKVVDAFLEDATRGGPGCEGGCHHRPLRVALQSVSEVVERVHTLLESIKHECALHEQRYFHYWRTPDCMEQLNALENTSVILDQRLALALQISAQDARSSGAHRLKME